MYFLKSLKNEVSVGRKREREREMQKQSKREEEDQRSQKCGRLLHSDVMM